MNPPFKMRTETPMEKYRAETWGSKEPETIEWIKSFDPSGVFFDVGGNVGVYSLYAASLYPSMTIHAFEPTPENFGALEENRAMNRFYNIIPHQWAVGDTTGMCGLSGCVNEAGRSGAQATNGGDVPITSLDNLVCMFRGRTCHVKIDIDGQELSVVRGMQNTLPYIKSALIEASKASKGPIMDIMTGAGFTTDNRFNTMTPHSRERREREGIDAENIVFAR
jgi:FkbM family methyltransferase